MLNVFFRVNSLIFYHVRKQRVVPTNADILARVPLGAPLARNDVARKNGFAAIFFDAQTTTSGIATVA